MDFGTWSPSHTILVLIVFVTFVGQVAVYFYKTAQNSKEIERLEERMDKRFVELISTMNHQISDVRSEISDLRGEINHQISDVRSEISDLRGEINHQISDVRSEISDLRGEIRDLRLEMSKLNQNHVDHLTHHHNN